MTRRKIVAILMTIRIILTFLCGYGIQYGIRNERPLFVVIGIVGFLILVSMIFVEEKIRKGKH